MSKKLITAIALLCRNTIHKPTSLYDMKKYLIILLALALFLPSYAQRLSLPRFFSDGMVIQRGKHFPLWGHAEPGTTVKVSINGKTSKTFADSYGRWETELPKMKAGGPYDMTVYTATDTLKIANILVGDLFLCSGQSNMELPIRRCMDVVGDDVVNYSNDRIRYLKLSHQFNYVRANDDVAVLPWQNITPENCGEVGGLCYFMARSLQERYNVPIGIINSSVGGTRVEAWMPHEVLERFPGYDVELRKPKYYQPNWPDSVRAVEQAAAFRWERDMTATDTIIGRWRTDGYDFSKWRPVDMFSNWSDGKNGSYWFHTSIDLPAELAGHAAKLRFGAMKDADSIFVNGRFVGNTTYEYPPRIYSVPAGVLKPGNNDIVIHLMSQNGFPNFTKGKLYQLEVGETVIPISNTIHMAQGCTMPRKPSSTYFVDGNTGLYNAMIAPLGKLPFKGMVWYQGESNMGNPDSYANLFKAMVESWRKQFGAQVPLVIMQLPSYMNHHGRPVETGWTKIRNQQFLASRMLNNTLLAPLFDTGEPNDIHPQDKRTAGVRAAMLMARLAYGEKNLVTGGPMPQSMTVKDGKAVIRFTNESGILTVHGDRLNDFAIAANGQFKSVDAVITGPHTVELPLPEGVNCPVVRYGWDDFLTPSLFNSEGFPAPQFEIGHE